MKKTILIRLMALSLSVILVSSVVLGFVHFFLIQRYVASSRTDILVKNADRISALTEFLSDNYSFVVQKFYEENLNTISQSSDTFIFLTDLDGNILHSSQNAIPIIAQNRTIDISAFSDVKEGNTIVKKDIFNQIFNTSVITAASPLKARGRIYGVAFINYPYPTLNQDTYALVSLLLISIAIASIVSFILSYFLSVKLSKPIKKLVEVSGEFAKGEFQKRGVRSDIIELDELTTAFNTMAEKLEKNDNAHSTFIANVSHDLRTPITTISGFVGGILDGTIPENKQKDYLQIVLDESHRMSELVSVFLDLSRYQMGELQLTPTDFDINEEIRQTLIYFENEINNKGINIDLTLDSEECFVYADKSAISRVLTNLIDNAVKFVNPNGEINITVNQASKKAEISIENTGMVISAEDQKNIWDRFYKSDKSRMQDKKGFGLGLYIVKNIINQHGESIILQSGNNKTKFSFKLPMKS